MLFVTLSVFIKWLPETAHSLWGTTIMIKEMNVYGVSFGDTTLIAFIHIFGPRNPFFSLVAAQSLKLIMKSKGGYLTLVSHLFL